MTGGVESGLQPYVPRLLEEWPAAARTHAVEGTLLSADLSGFTALSERLAGLGREGAEELTSLLNTCFSGMIEQVERWGGDILKFVAEDLNHLAQPTCLEKRCRRKSSTPIPSEVATWPVTVSASTSRTRWPWWSWRAEARFVAIVVLPTPPFGLKIAITVARFDQAPISIEPPWMTGPEPSSTVTDRMHIASTRQRIESAV